MKIYCMVTDMGLIPLYDSDLDQKKRLKLGDTILCDIKKPRNYEFHKKFFALIRLTFDNFPEHLHDALNVYSEEDLLLCLKMDLGLCTVVRHGLHQYISPQSISFASMGETEFSSFYNRCVDIILSKYLRGTDKKDLLSEIERFK